MAHLQIPHHARVDGVPTIDYKCPYEDCGNSGLHQKIVQGVDSNKDVRKCKGCGRLFEVTPCLEIPIPYQPTTSVA